MITILLSHWIWGVIYYTGVDNRSRESRDKDPNFKSANNLSWELGKLFSCFGFQLNFALSHRLLWPSDHRNNFQMSSLQIQGCLSEMLLPKIFSSSPWIYIWSTGLNKEIREQISYSGNSELYIVINFLLPAQNASQGNSWKSCMCAFNSIVLKLILLCTSDRLASGVTFSREPPLSWSCVSAKSGWVHPQSPSRLGRPEAFSHSWVSPQSHWACHKGHSSAPKAGKLRWQRTGRG